MIYKFEQDCNALEATKNIFCMKGEDTVDYNTISRRFKKFCLGYKNLNDQARSGRPNTMDSEAML